MGMLTNGSEMGPELGESGTGEISDSNYSVHPLESQIGLSFSSTGTFLDNETNESTFITSVKDDLFPAYPQQLTNITAIVCVIFFIVGIPGNLITIIALGRCKKVRFMAIICS